MFLVITETILDKQDLHSKLEISVTTEQSFSHRASLRVAVSGLLAPLTGRGQDEGRTVEMFVDLNHLVLQHQRLSLTSHSEPTISTLTLASMDLRYLSAAEAGPKPVRVLARLLKEFGRMACV